MAQGTAAEIAQVIKKTPFFRGGAGYKFRSRIDQNDLPGDLGFSHYFNSLEEKL
jgi:hypothetical protein